MLESLIEDLQFLIQIEQFDVGKIDEITERLKTQEFKRFVQSLPFSKPETATELIFTAFFSELNLTSYSQASIKKGWIDYIISQPSANPVGFEVKPLFVKRGSKFKLNHIKYEDFIQQVKKYLTTVNYVVLTNGYQAFLFNREAIVYEKPFKEIPFIELINTINQVGNVWEALTRLEDATPKKDIDERFFADLMGWYELLSNPSISWIKNSHDVEELKILLLNKFIFAQTLEDFALIPFKYVESKYRSAQEEWSPKGYKKVVKNFLSSIDRWFYEYYDTELFKTDVTEFLQDSEENYKNFFRTLGKILGFLPWERIFGLGLTFYNYRQIDEDVFGKAYETFLAQNRKEQGIFYTPKEITQYMAKKLVEEVFSEDFRKLKRLITETLLNDEEYDKAVSLVNSIKSKAIIDPASGSGSFLIKVLREIAKLYKDIKETIAKITSVRSLEIDRIFQKKISRVKEIGQLLGVYGNKFRDVLELIIIRHIYAVDIDPKALDVAKVNLWKEAIKLSPREFRYTNLKETSYILPSLEMNFVNGDALYPAYIDKFVRELSENFKDEIKTLVALRKEYECDPQNRKAIEEFLRLKEEVKGKLKKKLSLYTSEPVIYPLEFPHLYFEEDGSPKRDYGFDGVIGNPPWENIKPIKKEFASKFPEVFGQISKFSIEGKEFEKMFSKKLKEIEELKERWEEYKERIKTLSEYYREAYPLHGKSGDLSYQKLFLELALRLSKKAIALLLPSNFHTDEGTKYLREYIFENFNLKELISFENRSHRWFKNVDPRFKFDIVLIAKERQKPSFKARFYVRDWNEVSEAFEYPVEVISKLSPENKGIVEFRKPEDMEIALKIKGNYPFLKDYGVWITTELHMTNDKELFKNSQCNTCVPLYEGKMIHQYDQSFSEPRYFVDEKEVREIFIRKEVNRLIREMKELPKKEKEELREWLIEKYHEKEIPLDYELPRLVYRAVARSTDERTLISCVLTEKAFLGNSLNFIKRSYLTSFDGKHFMVELLTEDFVYYLQALFNSFVLDYFIRLRVSANLNTFFVYELPIPVPDIEIYEIGYFKSVFKLPAPHIDYELSKEIIKLSKELSKEQGKDFKKRAKMELLIAKEVFGLSKEEFEYILSTFVYGKNVEQWQDLGKNVLKLWF